MKNAKSSIVFFGSGPVALRSLELLSENFEIEYVVTKPTTFTEMSSVTSVDKTLAVSTKEKLDRLIDSQSFNSKVAVLIDFGIIVSQKAIDSFPLGIVNSHFSLLPELRGADPITFAITEGKDKTGVSLMLLVEAMDEGPLIATGEVRLKSDETTPDLTHKLIDLSYSLLAEYLPRYISGQITPTPQDTTKTQPTYTRKLEKADGIIDWNESALQIERNIRGFQGWPNSRTNINGLDCIIVAANVSDTTSDRLVGEFFTEDKKLLVNTGEGLLDITNIKPAGKKEMTAEAFLAGYKSKVNLV